MSILNPLKSYGLQDCQPIQHDQEVQEVQESQDSQQVQGSQENHLSYSTSSKIGKDQYQPSCRLMDLMPKTFLARLNVLLEISVSSAVS